MSSNISKHLDKKNLHHAYLIEGAREEILPELLKFLKDEEVIQINLDSFKIDDARNFKSYGSEKGYSDKKKVFIISANNFLLEAQNTLLKMFEEPIENTYFFLVVPDANSLLKTLVSRFYLITARQDLAEGQDQAEEFIKMPLAKRIDFLKEFLAMPEEDEEGPSTESSRSKALRFLNALEGYLHTKVAKNFSGFTLPGIPGGTYTDKNSLQLCFGHFFKVRKFLRMPGSSAKNLMESVALITPVI